MQCCRRLLQNQNVTRIVRSVRLIGQPSTVGISRPPCSQTSGRDRKTSPPLFWRENFATRLLRLSALPVGILRVAYGNYARQVAGYLDAAPLALLKLLFPHWARSRCASSMPYLSRLSPRGEGRDQRPSGVRAACDCTEMLKHALIPAHVTLFFEEELPAMVSM
jgi:hypothetical protein